MVEYNLDTFYALVFYKYASLDMKMSSIMKILKLFLTYEKG